MQNIESLRSEIDEIHGEMATLFRQRLKLAHQIWQIKKNESQLKIDPIREAQIIHRFDSDIHDPIEQIAMQNFFRGLLLQSRTYLQEKNK